MGEQDPLDAALGEVLRTLQVEPGTAQAVGAACIKPGIDGTASAAGATAMCNEGELIRGGAESPNAAAAAPTPEGCKKPGMAKAEEIGLDERGIKQILQSLLSTRTSMERRIVFIRAGKKLDSAPSTEEVRQAVSEYRVAKIKEKEQGPLFHYHQTPAANLGDILEQGGLLSTEEQRRKGMPHRSTGSRPDVVQFTRDSYTSDGKLQNPGLIGGNNLGVDGGIALVYGPEIMDSPGYDPLDTYPGIPAAPSEKLKAVLVSDPNDIGSTTAQLAAHGVDATVTTRDQWAAQHYGAAA